MPITDLLRMPSDIVLTPVAELAIDVRERLAYNEGDYALTRPRVRTPSRIIDAAAAELLREFARPSTVAQAVIRFARARGASPQTTLEEAYPLLARLFAGGLLISDEGGNLEATYSNLGRGELVGTWEVTEPIQLLDDSEVHQVKNGTQIAVLKIERPGSQVPSLGAGALLRREAIVLEALDGTIAPRLIEIGVHDARQYLAIEWCPGISSEAYARELRFANDRSAILALCREIVACYVHLHARGFVHGDVHPRNVWVGPTGNVLLLDFGVAASTIPDGDMPPTSERAGVSFFYEPEFAAAALDGRSCPASPAGEQYAVAALLYSLATGTQYLDFSLERETLFGQIATESPRPFAARGTVPWPELEAVLEQALSKAPLERYSSMDAMAAALAEVKVMTEALPRSTSPSAARALLDRVSAEFSVDGSLGAKDISVPNASLFFGTAGIACALYRLALLRDSAAYLAASDMWLSFAESSVESPEAFLDPASDLTAEIVGTITPFHTASGLAAMRALVANAQGDVVTARQAAARFARFSLEGARHANRDLTLGRSGVLLGAALLGDVLPDDAPERAELARSGGRMLDALWSELDTMRPLALQRANLGMAHGWCGYVYASLRFCSTFGHARPKGIERRVYELADVAEPWDRGVRWRWNDHGVDLGTMPGWCNGSAGFVHLFTLAHRQFKEQRFLDLAIGAAWNAWEAGDGNGSLCCGEAGRGYALIALARHLGDDAAWLGRAGKLSDRAALAIVQNSEKPHSLFKGRVGVALLAADLEKPEVAAFPFFEDEGWR
ncbi:MAG: lanthionine synthetase LanC family protein [Candidatus Cybelea sp.]